MSIDRHPLGVRGGLLMNFVSETFCVRAVVDQALRDEVIGSERGAVAGWYVIRAMKAHWGL